MYMQQHILKHQWWALVVVVLVCMTGCSNVEKDWEKAESENTIAAYEDFMKRYPEGPQADKARLKIEEIYFEEAQTINTIPAYQEFLKQYPKGPVADKAHLMVEKLYNDRKPAFRHTKTVKIIVNQSYGEAEGVSLPFEDIARRLCQYAGLQVVEAEAEDYDVTLKIQAKGEAEGNFYTGSISGYQYSGASLSGTITLKIPGIPAYKKYFEGYISPPFTIIDKYPDPSSAPFDWAFRKSGSFISKIIEMMGEVYGSNTLIAALKDEYRYVREKVAEALEKIGKPAVELLIAALLKHNDSVVRRYAAEALGDIKDSRAVEPLIAALEDEDSDVRTEAAHALGEIGDSWAVEPLIAALNDWHVSVRERAARALGEIRDSRAVEPLIAALQDRDSYVLRELAAEALKKITNQDFGENRRAWSKWWQENKKKYQQQ